MEWKVDEESQNTSETVAAYLWSDDLAGHDAILISNRRQHCATVNSIS